MIKQPFYENMFIYQDLCNLDTVFISMSVIISYKTVNLKSHRIQFMQRSHYQYHVCNVSQCQYRPALNQFKNTI